MNIDPGLVVIIGAVLAFYLRMIILQRQRAKQAAAYQPKPAGKNKSKRPGKAPARSPAPDYSIISSNKRDWIIAGAGILLILIGILLNLKAIPLLVAQNYWWLPVAIGIVAFSWGFK
jgi:hypothetical protein